MVDVIQVQPSEDNHPLFEAYKNSYRWEDDIDSLMKEYSTQELIVFTNIGEDGFEKEKIERFWSGNFDIRFISMIHVDNEIAENNSLGLSAIINKINSLFEGKEYLYYYSFDYSGIVLLANDMTIKEYLNNLFCLNYKLENKTNLIRDSFSLCGISRRLLQNNSKLGNYNENKQNLICDKDYWNESYIAVTNIGILDYTKYRTFWKELKSQNEAAKRYGLLGRQDVSIVNTKANLEWLLTVQALLDKYTSNQEKSFYSYETFIKVKIDSLLDDSKNINEQKMIMERIYHLIRNTMRKSMKKQKKNFHKDT